ncbi:methylenetetrahydrofolate reductase [Deefgea piscis]|uniref:Methylenetetrahydrofolate reductase n=1 Tax=Deefgea piscis TaxID=2739061 RepID=A0A6M8SNR6_9NEIS|nr:methylenetetrahydrofolate reductase [Deefgea piscis]QKJ66321.1 methylenetetrahydrofolate reductase [Deefgea piscis]
MPNSLHSKIAQRQSGILLYGITPPKANNTPEKIAEIAALQIERIAPLGLDGLVLYDIQDEADRTDATRPFPFMATLDPLVYSRDYLAALDMAKIVYRCVGKYAPAQFGADLLAMNDGVSVFVGAASRQQQVSLTVAQAYALRREVNPHLLVGGVAIPERHLVKNDEHLRVAHKVTEGCSFFVTQCVYNVEAAKNFLSDYYYACQQTGTAMVPIIFTITPCGSVKTLEFMKWLGISIPKWLENDLIHSGDILAKSLDVCKGIFAELLQYASEKGIPVGCNIESVAIRKDEIEASLQLVRDVQQMFVANQA